jgi:DNA-binding transcriptional ArsR family regulator
MEPCQAVRYDSAVRPIRHPDPAQVRFTDVMHALSDPARIQIVEQLARARRPLTCGDITGDRPKSSMSHHFRILREAGLIETQIEGKEHFNRLREAEMARRFPGLLPSLLRAMRQG